MFGIGGSEILVILVIALLFLGPDKLPEAAKTISKGIRDLKKQSRALQNQIEGDEQIGGAIRDLKSALRGEDAPLRPPVRRQPPTLPAEATEGAIESPDPSLAAGPAAALTLPEMAGEPDPDVVGDDYHGHPDYDDLGHLIKPAPGAIAKGESFAAAEAASVPAAAPASAPAAEPAARAGEPAAEPAATPAPTQKHG